MIIFFCCLAASIVDPIGLKTLLLNADKVQAMQTATGEVIVLQGAEARALAKLLDYGSDARPWSMRPREGLTGRAPPFVELVAVAGEESGRFYLFRDQAIAYSLADNSKGTEISLTDTRLWDELQSRFETDIDRNTLKSWPIFEHDNFTGYDQFQEARAIIWSGGDLLVADEKANSILIYDATTNPLRPKLRQKLQHPDLSIPRLLAKDGDRVLVVGEHLLELKKKNSDWIIAHTAKHRQLIDATACFASPGGKFVFVACLPERRLLRFALSETGLKQLSPENNIAIGDAVFSKDGKTAYFVSEEMEKLTGELRVSHFDEATGDFSTLFEKNFSTKVLFPVRGVHRLAQGNIALVGERVYTAFSPGKVVAWKEKDGQWIEEKAWKSTFGGISSFWGPSLMAVGENGRLWTSFEATQNVAWFNPASQPGGMAFGGSYRGTWRQKGPIYSLTVSDDGRFCYFVNQTDLIVLGGERKDVKNFYPRLPPDGRGEGDELYWDYFWKFRGQRDHLAKPPTDIEWREILKVDEPEKGK